MSNQYHPYYTHPQGVGAPVQAQGPGPDQARPPSAGPGPYQTQPAAHQGYGQGGYGASYPAAYYQGAAPHPQVQYQAQTPFFNFSNDRFLKGLLIGAAATYLLTNESVQRGAIKGAVKVWSMLQGGVEEIKERFHDAEAEIRAAEAAPKE
jgi:hypothetical protein